jgi:hypothetical protein
MPSPERAFSAARKSVVLPASPRARATASSSSMSPRSVSDRSASSVVTVATNASSERKSTGTGWRNTRPRSRSTKAARPATRASQWDGYSSGSTNPTAAMPATATTPARMQISAVAHPGRRRPVTGGPLGGGHSP